MTNWEKCFGTPARAALVDTDYLFDPYNGYAGRVCILFCGRKVFEYEMRLDYLKWLESEADNDGND